MALACASRKLADMYFVYILKSTLINWNYVGLTQNLDNRIMQHNQGHVKSTKHYKPLCLIFAQIVNSRLESRNLEKFLKIRFNKEALLELIL